MSSPSAKGRRRGSILTYNINEEVTVPDVRLTDEMLKRVQGCVGFDLNDTFAYVPKAFREKNKEGSYVIPKELWPVFTLKSRDGVEVAEIEDVSGMVEYKDGASLFHPQSGKHRIATLERGLKAIKRMPLEKERTFDWDGETVRISDGTTKKADAMGIIRYLKASLQVELQNAINERSTLTEEEKRGLES